MRVFRISMAFYDKEGYDNFVTDTIRASNPDEALKVFCDKYGVMEYWTVDIRSEE